MDCPRCKRRIPATGRYYLRRYGVCKKCLALFRAGEPNE